MTAVKRAYTLATRTPHRRGTGYIDPKTYIGIEPHKVFRLRYGNHRGHELPSTTIVVDGDRWQFACIWWLWKLSKGFASENWRSAPWCTTRKVCWKVHEILLVVVRGWLKALKQLLAIHRTSTISPSCNTPLSILYVCAHEDGYSSLIYPKDTLAQTKLCNKCLWERRGKLYYYGLMVL